MSLRRRKRRQNRLDINPHLATRLARPNLGRVLGLGLPVQRLRSLKLFDPRHEERPRIVIEPSRNELRLSDNRDVRQLVRLHDYDKIRAKTSREKRKPLTTIQLDGNIRVDLPPDHPICVARSQRKEILFAENKAGKGGQRPRRQNNNIKLRCK